MENAAREIYWNIPKNFVWLMYVILSIAVVICLIGVINKIRSWKKGKNEPGFQKQWMKRLWSTVKEILLQIRVRNRPVPGIFHSAFFWSFIALFVVTLVVFVEADFGLKIYHGHLYLVLSFVADAAGLIFFIGLIVAFIRRFIQRPEHIERKRFDWLLYTGLFYIIISGFFLEALRIAVTNDPWAEFSPVGWALSFPLKPLVQHAGPVHAALWWSHLSVVAVIIATLPWSRMMHIFTIPANIFMRDPHYKSFISRVDVEPLMEMDEFNYGLSKTDDMSWKQRMDLDACTGCGRCEEVCPAHLSGGDLSPRKFIAAIKESLEKGNGFSTLNQDSADGDGLEENIIWYCRTCYACVEVCPSMVNHVRFMIELRQNKTMIHGEVPSDLSRALQSMQTRGNPWGPQLERTEWLDSNDVRVLKKGEETDMLYWLGCCTSYDQTKQRVAVHMINLMRTAGVDFAILGDEEVCCGDPARIMGDESVFQETVKGQIEKLNAVKFNRIVTHCPHCYNVLKNEYPWFGANYEVIHHSDFLLELITKKRLKPTKALERKIVFHDPCYLGRYQNIYESPRKVLKSIPKIELIEMEHHHDRSFCCGGGGGHYWMDLKNGKRLGDMRVDEAAATGADTIVVACVYCMQMIEDSVKNKDLDEKMKVLDIADILIESTESPKTMAPFTPKK